MFSAEKRPISAKSTKKYRLSVLTSSSGFRSLRAEVALVAVRLIIISLASLYWPCLRLITGLAHHIPVYILLYMGPYMATLGTPHPAPCTAGYVTRMHRVSKNGP